MTCETIGGRRWSRPSILGGLALLAAGTAGCWDAHRATPLGPNDVAPVRLATSAVAYAQAGVSVALRASYRRRDGSDVELGSRTAALEAGRESSVPLTMDIAPCLRDAERAGTTDGCEATLLVRLLRGTTTLDEQSRTLVLQAGRDAVVAQPLELFEVARVTVAPSGGAAPRLEVRGRLALTATAFDRSGAAIAGRDVTWRSLQPTMVRVDERTGQAEGLAATTAATVQAVVGGRTGSIDLTVMPETVRSLAIRPADTTVAGAATIRYVAEARGASGAIVAEAPVRFTAGPSTVVVITTDGVAQTLGIGVATITATTPGADGATVTATARLVVESRPLLALTPTGLAFRAEVGAPLPPEQTVAVTNAGGGTIGGLTLTLPPDGVTATLDRTVAPATLTVRATTTPAAGATISRVIRVSSSTLGAFVDLPVTVTGVAGAAVVVDQPTADLGVLDSGTVGSARALAVTSSTTRVLDGLTASVAYATGAPTGWLTATVGAATPTSAQLRADARTLPPGVHTATVTIASTVAGAAPARIAVRLEVRRAGVLLDRSTLALGPIAAGTTSPTADVQVTGTDGRTFPGLTASVAYDAGQPTGWLVQSLTSAATPSVLRVAANAASLAAGSYGATVTVASSTPGAEPARLRVTLSVVASAGLRFQSLAAGTNHTCGITVDLAVYCWGKNDFGQLGVGDLRDRSVPTLLAGRRFAAIAAGSSFTCALTEAREAYCWGLNQNGQLGNGTTASETAPRAVAGPRFASLVAGGSFACGLTDAAQTYCWGNNFAGQLGIGARTQRETPTLVPDQSFVSLAAGQSHACAVAASTEGFCWGNGASGQIGLGNLVDQLAPIALQNIRFRQVTGGQAHSCGITAAGVTPAGLTYCWGSNQQAQLGVTGIASRAIPGALATPAFGVVRAGDRFTCGATSGGEVWCWGENTSGQIGIGAVGGNVAQLQRAVGVAFASFTTGGNHACGVTPAGDAYCWGSNSGGQLGTGGAIGVSQPTPTRVANP